MRYLIILVTVLGLAVPAMAGPTVKQLVPFANISAASAAVKTTSAINITGLARKTFHVSGVTLTSSPTSVTYKNMSGTIKAQCAPTSGGPWSTCIANGYAQTDVSKTTNGSMSWEDISSYVRFHWTAGTVGGKLKVWLNLSE